MSKALRGKDFIMSVLRNGDYFPICVARNVTIELDGDINEATKPEGGTMRTYYYGFNTYKVTVDGLVSIDSDQFTQSELEDLKINRQVLSFKCEDSGNPGVVYSGDLLIENISKSTAYNEAQSFTMSCQGSGDLFKSGSPQNTNIVKNVQFTQTGNDTGTITFEAIGTATSWQYRVNGGALLTTPLTTIYLTGINSIRNNILITPDNGNGTSYDFTMAGICYSAVTSLTVQQIDSDTLLASWVATSSATMFKWEAGGQSGTVATTSIVIPNMSGFVTVTITPLCSNNILGTPMSKGYTLIQTCDSAIGQITYTQGLDTADIHFLSSGSAVSFEYQVNDGSWIATTAHDIHLTGLVQLQGYVVIIRPKCVNNVYGQSGTLVFTASGSLLNSQSWNFTFTKNNCTGDNSLGTQGTYTVSEGTYTLTQSSIKTIADDLSVIDYPGYITSVDRTGMTFGLTPDNIGTKYPIDDTQTSINSKTAFLAWAVTMDGNTNGQSYVNGAQTCRYIPGIANVKPIITSALVDAGNSQIIDVDIEAPITYNDTSIDILFSGMVSLPNLNVAVLVKYIGQGGATKYASGSFLIDRRVDGKGWGGEYYINTPDVVNSVIEATTQEINIDSIITTWRAPYTNIKCNQIALTQ